MKASTIQFTVFAAVLATAACAPPPAATTGTPADETAIRDIAAKYSDGFNKRDAAALAALVTPDYQTVANDHAIVKGRAGFEAREKEGLGQLTGLPLKLNAVTTFVRWTSATSAAAGGTWTMDGVPPGMGLADKGSWTGTFVKEGDGMWRMATGLVSEFHPPPAPPAATPVKGK